MGRLRIVGLWVVLASALSGCAFLKDLLRDGFTQPTLRFQEARVADVSLGGATIDLLFTIDNPNPIGLSLTKLDYAFFVEGKQLAAGRPSRDLEVPATGSATLSFPASFQFAQVAQAVDALLTKDVAAYRAQGTIGVGTPLGPIELPLSHEGTFEIPKVPEVELLPVKLSRVSLSGAAFEVGLKLKSKNSYPLPLGALEGQLFVGGASVGAVRTQKLGLLPAKGTQEVRIPVTVSFLGAAQAAQALQSGTAKVSFEGRLGSGLASVPLRFGQTVGVAR
jgi:LEA14-like dessication related protein